MKQQREIVFFGRYFEDFFDSLEDKIKDKVDQVLYMISMTSRIPEKFFKHLKGTDGLYEIRILHAGNSYRIFCCFDKGNLIVLFNGFLKKSQKTPKVEIEKALRIKRAYFESKKK